MANLPDQLYIRYSSGLSYDPDHACFGWDSAERFLAEKRYNHALLTASTELISLSKVYVDSYANSSAPTLMHYRDRLLGKALALSMYNMQFVDEEQTKLTSHSDKVWKVLSHQEIWNHIPVSARSKYSFRFASTLGSAAFYMKDLNLEGLYPLECLQKTLDYVWSLLGKPRSNTSPSERHRWLLEQLKIPVRDLSNIREAVLYLLSDEAKLQLDKSGMIWVVRSGRPWQTRSGKIWKSREIKTLTYRRMLLRNLIGANDARSLTARLLLGEYNPALLDIAFGYLSLEDDSVSDFRKVLYSILPPAGMPLVYMFFIIESLCRAADRITNLNPLLRQTLMAELLKGSTDEHRLLAADLSEDLALASDAAGILSLFNTVDSAYELKSLFLGEVMFWLAASKQGSVSSNAGSRLSLFSNFIDA